jgi:DNA ligase-1
VKPAAKTAAKPAAKKAAGGGGMSTPRRFEFSEGTSNKFWEVWVEGTQLMTKYGKIGSSGSQTVKDFGTDEKVKKEYDKIVAEKTKKGYEETAG